MIIVSEYSVGNKYSFFDFWNTQRVICRLDLGQTNRKSFPRAGLKVAPSVVTARSAELPDRRRQSCNYRWIKCVVSRGISCQFQASQTITVHATRMTGHMPLLLPGQHLLRHGHPNRLAGDHLMAEVDAQMRDS